MGLIKTSQAKISWENDPSTKKNTLGRARNKKQIYNYT